MKSCEPGRRQSDAGRYTLARGVLADCSPLFPLRSASGSAAGRASNRHGVTEGSTYVRMEQKERIQYVVRGVAKYREFPF